MKTIGTYSALLLFILSLGLISGHQKGYAFTIEKHADAPVENRFVVGPAKIEATVASGDTKTVNIDVENRTGRTELYTISFDDFVASKDPNQTVVLSEGSKSNTSLRDSLYTPELTVTLEHGDRVRIPVTISIPANETPGGKFGSVIVSAQAVDGQTSVSGVGASTAVVGQVATLLFVTVPGEIHHEAHTESFRIARNESVFFVSPITFQIAYRNSGATYENPYGGITIRNMFGYVVQSIPVDPWFVLPGSLRTREVVFAPKNLFGFYTATLELNRGYEDVVDTTSLSFTAFNPRTVALIVLVVVGLVWFVRVRATRKIAH